MDLVSNLSKQAKDFVSVDKDEEQLMKEVEKERRKKLAESGHEDLLVWQDRFRNSELDKECLQKDYLKLQAQHEQLKSLSDSEDRASTQLQEKANELASLKLQIQQEIETQDLLRQNADTLRTHQNTMQQQLQEANERIRVLESEKKQLTEIRCGGRRGVDREEDSDDEYDDEPSELEEVLKLLSESDQKLNAAQAEALSYRDLLEQKQHDLSVAKSALTQMEDKLSHQTEQVNALKGRLENDSEKQELQHRLALAESKVEKRDRDIQVAERQQWKLQMDLQAQYHQQKAEVEKSHNQKLSEQKQVVEKIEKTSTEKIRKCYMGTGFTITSLALLFIYSWSSTHSFNPEVELCNKQSKPPTVTTALPTTSITPNASSTTIPPPPDVGKGGAQPDPQTVHPLLQGRESIHPQFEQQKPQQLLQPINREQTGEQNQQQQHEQQQQNEPQHKQQPVNTEHTGAHEQQHQQQQHGQQQQQNELQQHEQQQPTNTGGLQHEQQQQQQNEPQQLQQQSGQGQGMGGETVQRSAGVQPLLRGEERPQPELRESQAQLRGGERVQVIDPRVQQPTQTETVSSQMQQNSVNQQQPQLNSGVLDPQREALLRGQLQQQSDPQQQQRTQNAP